MLREAKDLKMLLFANAAMLLVFPALVFAIASAFFPAFALPLLLLAAMPSGMTSPLLTEVVGGKTGLALILTLTTSLLAPITIPIILVLFAKTAVTIGAGAMFWTLVKIIVFPFLMAQGARHLWHKKIQTTFFTFKPISLALLGLLIAGVVGKQADLILENFASRAALTLAVLFLFIATLSIAGYYIAPWRSCDERMTVSVCLTFMNFTLAIYLAGTFFSDPNVLLASVLVVFPWTLLLFPLKIISKKILCSVK